MMENIFDFAVVGGGIAGISCAEMLIRLNPSSDILVVSASYLVRRCSVTPITKHLHWLSPDPLHAHQLERECAKLRVKCATVLQLNAAEKTISLDDGTTVTYRQSVCLCAGGRARVLSFSDDTDDSCTPGTCTGGTREPCVLGIRDTESVRQFVKRLDGARRVVIVGNGGIASELAYTLHGIEVVWVIRDDSVSSTFVDAGCAEFMLADVLSNRRTGGAGDRPDVCKRWKYTVSGLGAGKSELSASHRSLNSRSNHTAVPAGALGPDWLQDLDIGDRQRDRSVSIETNAEVVRLHRYCSGDWSVCVELTNGRRIDCDFVVSATGVTPNTDPFLAGNDFSLAEDGGMIVDESMRTSVDSVYAAGDICTPGWELSPHWFQMRLWSQARQMGQFAALCMSSHARFDPSPTLDICFELFAHVTQLFGRKLVLLGLFNGQKLGREYTALVRVTPGEEYVKAVVCDGRVQGALLLGDTDLEETFENLILSQLDVSHLGDDLLSPHVDLEDYFD